MRAAVLTGIRQMVVCEVPDPEIADPHDVLLRVNTVGVCGSDVHYYASGRIGSQEVEYPWIVGHECSATVESAGSGVTRVKSGDRVAVEPAVYCGVCDQCCAGRENTCRALKFLACPGQLAGCLSDYIVLPESCCYPVPAGMSFTEAALAEPLSIGLYATQRSISLRGARIAILGAGPIGLSVMLPALASGVERCYATDLLDYRCRTAVEHGASWAGNPDETDVVAEIQEREPLLLDAVFECCGKQEALDQAVELLKPGGKVMMVGIPEFDRYSFQADTARRHELCFQHVRRQNGCVQAALDLTASGQMETGFMATHHFALEEAQQAFDLVDNYGDGVIKAMIHVEHSG